VRVLKGIIRLARKTTSMISPKLASSIMYRKVMNRKLTFNEKISYLKLNKYPNDKLIIQCSDKLLVRNYIESKGLSEYLVKLISSYDSVDNIDFDKLPNKFVLKCNHGCGYNILCKDKNALNKELTLKKLRKWIREDFGLVSSEPHYSKIKRRVICEEYLEDDILDYKFFCFEGVPKFFYIAQNVEGDFHNLQQDFYYPNGELADFYRTDHNRFSTRPNIPSNLNEMLNIASILSRDFEFVRVDLFNVSGKIYFSELTFSPCSGFMPIEPIEKDVEFGNLIKI